MKSINILCIVNVAVLLSLASCKQEEKPAATSASLPVVKAVEVQRLQPSMNVVLPGELKPWNKSNIFPRVKGYVGVVKADRGTVVKKGDVLVVLEAPELLSSLSHAQAQVASSQATVVEQKAKAKASTLTYTRMVETSRTAGAVSAHEMDMSYARMQADSALLNAAQNNLQAARSQYTSQSQLTGYLVVKAPFDGTVIERNVSPGDLVGPEGNIKPMFVLEDHSKLRLTVAIPENLSNSVSEKSAVKFSVQADPQKIYEASFARSANSLLETNRMMMAEFDVDNHANDLKAGMYAEVRVSVTRSKPTFFVPKTALIQSPEGVFVIQLKGGTAHWLSVQKGNSLDSLTEVFGALETGEKIVSTASEEVRNGQSVQIQ